MTIHRSLPTLVAVRHRAARSASRSLDSSTFTLICKIYPEDRNTIPRLARGSIVGWALAQQVVGLLNTWAIDPHETHVEDTLKALIYPLDPAAD